MLWKERSVIIVCGYHILCFHTLFSHTFNSCDFLSKRRIRQFTGREGNSNLKFVKDGKKILIEYEPIATKEMSSCFKKNFSSGQKLMHLVKLCVISRDFFHFKDENLGLIDVKSPTASCWWNENLDLVNTQTHSFSSSQWDCSKVVISLIWKKNPEVQCFFLTSAEMKGGEMKSILDEVKPWDLFVSSSPLARLQASGNLASATGWIWRWKPPAWAHRRCRRCIGRPQGQDSLTSRLFLALVREIPQHLSYWQLSNIIKSICLSQKKYVILYLQTRLQVVVSYT